MLDINGKEIKAGMCLELLYSNGIGIGVGVISEKQGKLGFVEDGEFFPLDKINKDSLIGLMIVKE